MARVLVIEDEQSLRSVLDYHLRQAGHDVLLAQHADEGLRLSREQRPDLVLLDLALPGSTGTEACGALKAEPITSEIPFILVSPRGDEIDRVLGFELGAADYIVKPFSVRELVLRVAAVLRRARRPAAANRIIEIGALRIDEDAHRVWVDGEPVELTLLEYKLLVALGTSPDRVLTRAALLDGIWGIDVSITTRTIDTHVKRLRDKLGRAGRYIQTVRGIGFRFTEDVTDERSEA